MKVNLTWLGLTFLVLTLFGCYPVDDLTFSDLDLVITTPDESVNFSAYQTFSLPDSIVKITESDVEINRQGPTDDLMLNLVRSNLLQLGYSEELSPNTNPPDLVALIAKVRE